MQRCIYRSRHYSGTCSNAGKERAKKSKAYDIILPYLSLGQWWWVLQHVHDDWKKLIHPLSHFQATHLALFRKDNRSDLREPLWSIQSTLEFSVGCISYSNSTVNNKQTTNTCANSPIVAKTLMTTPGLGSGSFSLRIRAYNCVRIERDHSRY